MWSGLILPRQGEDWWALLRGGVAARGIARCVQASASRPSLEGRGWGWVGFRVVEPLGLELAYPPPAPPFQGGGKSLCGRA